MNKIETHCHKDASGIIVSQGGKQFRRRSFLKDFKYIFMLFFNHPGDTPPWSNFGEMNKIETHAPKE